MEVLSPDSSPSTRQTTVVRPVVSKVLDKDLEEKSASNGGLSDLLLPGNAPTVSSKPPESASAPVDEPSSGIANPVNELNSWTYLYDIAEDLFLRFNSSGNIDDLDKAISSLEKAIALLPVKHEKIPVFLNRLGTSLRQRFEHDDDRTYIDRAIDALSRATDLADQGHPHRAEFLNDLGNCFRNRFENFENLLDMDSAISRLQEAISLTPDGHEGKPRYLTNLGTSFICRFEDQGLKVDIDNAISSHQQAVALTADGHDNKSALCNNLGNAYLRRFESEGDLADIDQAILLQESSVAAIPSSHAYKAGRLNNLGTSVFARFERTGDLKDIHRAIDVQKQSISLTDNGDAKKPGRFSNLGNSLLARYERLNDLDDLSRATSTLEEAVSLTPNTHPRKAVYLNNLANCFQAQFERTREIADIDHAISLLDQAAALNTGGKAVKASRLHNLAACIMSRFECLSDVADIDRALSLRQQILTLVSDKHPDKAAYLESIGTCFLSRYERLGHLADATRAIEFQDKAIKLLPDDHADKAQFLSNQSMSFIHRYNSTKDVAYLNRCITTRERAVELTQGDSVGRASYLSSLGRSYIVRFEHSHNPDDAEHAISLQEQAVALLSDDHSDMAPSLNNLGTSYFTRFQKYADAADADHAISAHKRAVTLTPDRHATKPRYLRNLARVYHERFQLSKDNADVELAISNYRLSACWEIGLPSTQLESARKWGQLSLDRNVKDVCLDAYKQFFAILPRLVWLGLQVVSRYDILAFNGIREAVNEAAAAAISFKEYDLAVEWLEEGRSIIWGQILHLRTSMDDLRGAYPGLAKQLELVSQQLEHAGTARSVRARRHTKTPAGLTWENEAHAHHLLADRYAQLVAKARNIPGFERLLLPKTLSELLPVTKHGAVVLLNAHKSRCDALILGHGASSIIHVPLPALDYEKAENLRKALMQILRDAGVSARGLVRRGPAMVRQMPRLLGTLWSTVVEPILQSLGYMTVGQNHSLPHVTWCATGPLAFLPLHAAGRYEGKSPQRVFDYIISSYTPTLTALLEASKRKNQPFHGLLAISQPATPGQSRLPGTVKEVQAIKEHFNDRNFRWLNDSEATVDAVLEGMEKSSWCHLACHGVQHPEDPTKSAFLLQDGRLELTTIMAKSFQFAEMAFLSACQTAAGDDQRPEEAIHLAAGMLMAGYRSVFATMWSIGDKEGHFIADKVYSHLMKDQGQVEEDRTAAKALHLAVASLRNETGEKDFVKWMPFIHMGV